MAGTGCKVLALTAKALIRIWKEDMLQANDADQVHKLLLQVLAP